MGTETRDLLARSMPSQPSTLPHTVDYNTFGLAVYTTCFDIYNVILMGVCFRVTNLILAQSCRLWLHKLMNISQAYTYFVESI
jgi:hypothetical protein